MDCLSPNSGVEQTIIQKAAQTGASEFSLNVIGFYLSIAPAPILAVQPSLEMARRFSRQRLAEMLDLAPSLSMLTAVPRGGKLPSSELFKATTSGAVLILTGANSPSSLRSLPARIVVLDECDAYPGDVGGEGDPCDLAIARAESYGSAKRILLISTPTERGLSRIERLYDATDKRRYFVRCPHCAGAITLEFEQLRIEGDDAIYLCQRCGDPIPERDKMQMVEAGEWRATATCEPQKRGYHVSQLYSPWTAWTDLIRRHEAAKGYPEKERVFQNCGLGQSWQPPALQVPDADELVKRAEPFVEGVVPIGGAFLTAGVDVQADRLEIEVVAWGKDFESWSIAYHVLYGDISEPMVWGRLDALLTQPWPHASGMPMTLQAVCIDSGFSPTEVTGFTRSRHGQRIYATKGASNSWGHPIWPRRASWDKNKHAIYLVAADEAKSWVANRLRIDQPGAGFMHFPLGRDRSWYEMLVAERLVFQKNAKHWVNPQRLRNEAGDCRALAVAALHSRLLAGVDLNQWVEQFEQLIAPPVVNGAPMPAPKSSTTRSRFVWG